jgi:hypothetical protein
MTSRVSGLLRAFRDRGKWSSNKLYLCLPEAREFLDVATKMGVRIIGIEGFDEVAAVLRPRLDLIADFSGVALTLANSSTPQFLAEVPPAVLFTFVLSE